MVKECFNKIEVLHTNRLVLTEVKESDINEIFKIFSNPEVAKYDWFRPINSKEEAMKFIHRYMDEYDNEEEITWGIRLKETNELIGICCLGDFDEEARRAEIGYDLVSDRWNSGFATEALEAIVHYGLKVMNLNRIEAFITPGNDASVRVLEKLNFTREGLVRERDMIKGKLEDGIIMAILQKDL
ncbi:GNAT family N-acetyltransferase [Anaeromicropila herbilytica]|uniref:Putative N-acetyltransferase YoaA n=1 Tax=Anaeromicropila herbilytica TaxID=2785025 RepID=A0A7R7EJG2_9FIRM|nr:GNAT family N-acetyltransferase [Anaeromicropila herbilytica]BCN29825.1 putative N-acetyltransferase YoaA [Anaeromicropila herbilytica]